MIRSKDYFLPVFKRFNITFTRGAGIYLYDRKNKYIDFTSGIAVNSLGHSHPLLIKTLNKQINRLWHVSNFYQTDKTKSAAKTIVESSSFADHIFFCNSGTEAVECGIKIIRKYFYKKSKSNIARIITFDNSFHGRTIAAISAANKYTEGFEPKLDGFDVAKFNDIDSVKSLIKKNTAGILIEPIQGEGGIRLANKNFILQLRKLCDQNDIVLFFDEVQSGIGRTGYLYNYQYYNIKPDLIALAKGLGSGFPVGACLSITKLALDYGDHGSTFGGNPLATSIAEKVIKTINKNHFLKNVKENGAFLYNELLELKFLYPNIIKEVRGLGLMLGIKISDQYSNIKIIKKLQKQYLLTIPSSDNVIRILPPLIIKRDQIIDALSILKNCLENI